MAKTAQDDLVQLVSFRIGDEEYGVDILQVQEINRMVPMTQVPQTPPCCEGVINLRGNVIPVIDLRRNLGLATKEHDQNTRIVVCDVAGNQTGMIVDSVQEVLRIPRSSVEPCPAAIAAGQDYLGGIARVDDRLILFLSVERLAGDMVEAHAPKATVAT